LKKSSLNPLPKAADVGIFLPAAVLIIISLCQIAWGTSKINSRWRVHEITIDGKSDDWLNALSPFKDEGLSIGFFNDAQYIYVCLASGERDRQFQIMSRGLILWMDSTSGKKKIFGIKYPLGRPGPPEGSFPKNQPTEKPAYGPEEESIQDFEAALQELEILGSGKDDQKRMRVDEIQGIEIAAKTSGELFVYELKIPLAQGDLAPYAVGTQPGRTISIGLEIPEFDSSFRKDRPGAFPPDGGMPGGGMGGRGGGMGGPGGGMGMRGNMDPMAGKLKIWAKVQLSSQPNTENSPR